MNYSNSSVRAAEQKHAKVKSEVVVEIIAAPTDRHSLNELLCGAGWKSEACDSLAAAMPLLSAASVVMCDERLADGNWRDVLSQLETLPASPPLIVTSRLADDRLWAEVLNLGAYDLLMEPFQAEE